MLITPQCTLYSLSDQSILKRLKHNNIIITRFTFIYLHLYLHFSNEESVVIEY